MRRNTFISVLILAAAGCSVSNDDLGAKDYDDERDPLTRPVTADELSNEVDPVFATDYGLVLFDTSSSMNTVRPSTGNTRCADAKTMAKSQIDSFFNPVRYNGKGISIFAFDNAGSLSDDVQPTQVGYYTGAATAKTAIDNLTCGNGNDTTTPLADAMCKALNGDGETFTLNPAIDVMFIQTDGLENSSNGSADPYDPYNCDGPSGPISTAGTWQYNVYQMMTTTGISVSTAYWINPALLYSEQSIDSFALEESESDPVAEEIMIVAGIEGLPPQKVNQLLFGMETAQQQQAQQDAGLQKVCDNEIDCEIELIREMAIYGDEEWTVITDDNGDYPVEGDVHPPSGPVHPGEAPNEQPVGLPKGVY